MDDVLPLMPNFAIHLHVHCSPRHSFFCYEFHALTFLLKVDWHEFFEVNQLNLVSIHKLKFDVYHEVRQSSQLLAQTGFAAFW